MRLDEARWVLGGGSGREWKAVNARRAGQALADLKRLGALLQRGAPRGLERYKLSKSLSYLLAGPAGVRDRLAMFPAFDCWLSVGRSFETQDRPAAEWELHFPFLQSFAAAKAVLTGAKTSLPVRIGPDARFHLTGTAQYIEFEPSRAGKDAVIDIAGGTARASGGALRELTPVTRGLWVDYRDPLVLQPVRVHGFARPDAKREARFAAVLKSAMELIERYDTPLFEEIEDFLRIIVPLENPGGMGSVSSSYKELRGAFCLSHTEDVLLQAETIVHEFCHQKLNLLFAVDPLLEPGQAGEIVYSPLRPDPRRLHGMLLGAHAFINVTRFLIRALRGEKFSKEQRASIEMNTARRLLHSELMLRTLSGYAHLTEFGRRFTLRMWRENMLQFHDMLAFDENAVAAARKKVSEHCGLYRLGDTGWHSGKKNPAAGSKKK